MASIKKKSGGGGGANWMDTYGDMVTLLLCFFVLLYSISSLDEQKWMLIVQSFNKNAVITDDETPVGPSGDTESDPGGNKLPMTQDEIDNSLDELYQFLASYANQANSAGDTELDGSSITVSKGDGYVFISFNDAIFFNPDSSTLRSTGKAVLDAIIPALNEAAPFVDELRVLGHTAQARANQPNIVVNDRRLASNRAVEVVVYLQQNLPNLDPARLVDVGYGQWRPIASNEQENTRQLNRRVEMVITGQSVENALGDSITQYYTTRGDENEETQRDSELSGIKEIGDHEEDGGETP